MKRETIFSPCRKYRYTLWREFETSFLFDGGNKMKEGFVQFIGLNPSTADETKDDPTIRRCIGFAKAWGFGALCMTNLFAWRDTDPEKMKLVSCPVTEPLVKLNVNNKHLLSIAKDAALVIAAWGKDGKHQYRQMLVKAEFQSNGIKLHCLGLNGDGTPKHPLYLKATTQPEPFQ